MSRCRVLPSLTRKIIDDVAFPLGAYPVEEMTPRTGYTLTFEPADGDDQDGDWEEWPDRYVFDIFVSAVRVEPLCRALLAMLPGRFYPILDVLGHDEYREVDPYVAYELISQERFLDAIRRYRGYFYEDGLVGFGAMSEEPFVYVFVDEHKIVTVRVQADMRERVERLLTAFDLPEVEEIAGADAATHEHRGVLDAPDDRMDLLTADEIVEELRNEWGLVLNIDPDTNVDDDGNELGITGWRCLARHEVITDLPGGEGEAKQGGERASGDAAGGSPGPEPRYAEVLLTADSIAGAERLLWEGMHQLTGKKSSGPGSMTDPGEPEEGREGGEGGDSVDTAIALDRVTPESFKELLASASEPKAASAPGGGAPAAPVPASKKPADDVDMSESKVWHVRWLS
ncbi:MAG: hypothetical protein AB7G11_15455 [Phycisphaerales bacterium]